MAYGRVNPLRLDSMQTMITPWANQFFGRTDVSPDIKDGQVEALQDTMRDKDPELDRTLPWPLLMRGMFRILYKDALGNMNRRRGKKKWEVNDPLPTPIVTTPRDWADAFNFITVSYVKAQLFKRPR